ncbi:MAG: aldo/keto reductase [Acidimicrobiales bacterium]|nr:aldo/keto reductase [Acidimicrobiales bacterium]
MGLLNLDDAGALECLDAALDSGITAFDTAHVYGFEDRTVDGLLGRWIDDRSVRDEVIIMAKGCHPEPPDWETPRVTPEAVAVDVVDSLDRMGLDRIDLWSFHRDDRSVDVGSLVEAANAEIAANRISAWGVSNWSASRIQEAIAYADSAGLTAPVSHSAHYSLVDQINPPWDDVVTLTGETGAQDRQWHVDHGLPVIAWSALAGGLLSSNLSRQDFESSTDGHLAEVYRSYHSERNWARRSRAEGLAARLGVTLSDIAIAWLLRSDLAPMAIVGGATPEEIRQNATAAAIDLPPSDHQRLHQFEVCE